MSMEREAVIKKFEKAGLKVDRGDNRDYVSYNGKIASWSHYPAYNGDGTRRASSFHIRNEDDHSMIEVDYFAGYFLSNPTQLLSMIKPPPSKVNIGDLVMGKMNNKRANRYGVAGKTGVVIEVVTSSAMFKVRWLSNSGLSYDDSFVSYYTRDFDVLSSRKNS